MIKIKEEELEEDKETRRSARSNKGKHMKHDDF